MKQKTSNVKLNSNEFLDEKTRLLLIQRDPTLLHQMFSEINPYLLRVCSTSGVHNEHAEDIIHDTWFTFLTHIDRYEARAKIRTFLCGILINKIREYRRAKGKYCFEEDAESTFSQAFSHDGWWNNDPTDPYRISELKQAVQFINECLEGLSEQQKSAFILREVEDENADEICTALGVNLVNLRVLLFRAKDKLRQCLEGKAVSEEVI